MWSKQEHTDENGNFHREDGPAVEWEDGSKYWWIHGKLHREDGPAVEWNDESKSWWWEDKRIMETKGLVTEAQVKEFRLRRIS